MNASSLSGYIDIALALAERGRYTVSPNPMVGCVLVKEDRIIGQGLHQKTGEPHAEIYALQEAGEAAEGATAYITLEPCAHHGKTPPCVNALIKAHLKTVYIACLDPNPLVAGKGVQQLQSAGIEVHIGLREEQAKKLNEIFFHYITTQRPYVIAKWAMSLDGKTSVHQGDSRQLSGAEAQAHTHDLRHRVDAILIGARTLLADNPLLTVRHQPVSRQPLRVVLSTDGHLPDHLHLMNGSLPGKTLIATTNPNAVFTHCDKVVLPKNDNGQVSLPHLLAYLGEQHIASVLVEGGQGVHNQFFQENLVNQVHVYLAPSIVGSSRHKKLMPAVQFAALGRDIHITSHQENK